MKRKIVHIALIVHDYDEAIKFYTEKLDFVLIEEGIIIEVKQIREEEKNDKKFIQQIKIDLQSYHVLDYLKEIIFYVYAPKAIQDVNNFYELEGPQTINNKSFDVKIIVVQ